MISYYRLKKKLEISKDASKLGKNWSTLAKIVKNWYYVHEIVNLVF